MRINKLRILKNDIKNIYNCLFLYDGALGYQYNYHNYTFNQGNNINNQINRLNCYYKYGQYQTKGNYNVIYQKKLVGKKLIKKI